MIYITFRHGRNIFHKNLWASWVYKAFDFSPDVDSSQNIRFEGFEYGHHYPTIKISLADFEKYKNNIPAYQAKNIIAIKGEFSFLEQLAYGVRNFENDLRKEGFENLLKSHFAVML